MSAIEVLADRILWDRDFEMEEQLSSISSDLFSAAILRRMGVQSDYFSPILNDDLRSMICYSDNAVDDLKTLCAMTLSNDAGDRVYRRSTKDSSGKKRGANSTATENSDNNDDNNDNSSGSKKKKTVSDDDKADG